MQSHLMVESISELQKKVTKAEIFPATVHRPMKLNWSGHLPDNLWLKRPCILTVVTVNCSYRNDWWMLLLLRAGEITAGGEQGSTEGSKLPNSIYWGYSLHWPQKGLMLSSLVQLAERQKAVASRQQQQVQWDQHTQTQAQTSSSSSSFLMRQDQQPLQAPQNIWYTSPSVVYIYAHFLLLLQLINEVCIMLLFSYPPVTMGERGEEAAAAAQQQQQPGQAQPQLRIGGLPPWMISHLNAWAGDEHVELDATTPWSITVPIQRLRATAPAKWLLTVES